MQAADVQIDDLEFVQRRPSVKAGIEHTCWVVFWCNIALAVFKITVGAMGYSQLLILDGLHSAGNAVLVTLILLGLRAGRLHNVSEEYPYGFGKALFVAALLVGLLLASCAAVIVTLSIKTFLIPVRAEPTAVAMAAALISIGGNLLITSFLKRQGTKHDNTELKKMANLQWLNIMSSVIVFNTVFLGGVFGFYFAERIGSIIISLVVLALSIRILRGALDGIMDRSAGYKVNSRIMDVAEEVDHVEVVEGVRTRRVGHNLCVEIWVGIDGGCTIRQSDQVIARVRERLSEAFSEVFYVNVFCIPV